MMEKNDPTICAMIGASAATTIAGLPFLAQLLVQGWVITMANIS